MRRTGSTFQPGPDQCSGTSFAAPVRNPARDTPRARSDRAPSRARDSAADIAAQTRRGSLLRPAHRRGASRPRGRGPGSTYGFADPRWPGQTCRRALQSLRLPAPDTAEGSLPHRTESGTGSHGIAHGSPARCRSLRCTPARPGHPVLRTAGRPFREGR